MNTYQITYLKYNHHYYCNIEAPTLMLALAKWASRYSTECEPVVIELLEE